jgi:ArsR family transcriptional regulator
MQIDIVDAVPSQRASCCAPATPALAPAQAQELADRLDMLAHPVRLQILTVLRQHDGDVCVCDIEAAVPVKQPTVSHHLKLLRAAGIIDCERRGTFAYYFIKPTALHALWDDVRAALL